MSSAADVPGTRKYNSASPTIRRITAEFRALQKDPEPLFHAEPLPDNLFEWHFSFRGPPSSVYEGGIYHGKIILPLEYPLQPPTVMMLSPSGRFEENKKICLSATGFHPEMWQPSWTIKTLLLALIGFMESPGAGAIGSVEASDDQRREIAAQSRSWKCKVCGMDHADPDLFPSPPPPSPAPSAEVTPAEVTTPAPLETEPEEETLSMRTTRPPEVDESPEPKSAKEEEKPAKRNAIDARLVLQQMRAARKAAHPNTECATAAAAAEVPSTTAASTTTTDDDNQRRKRELIARILDWLISLCLVVVVAIVTRRVLMHHNSGKK